MRRDDFCDHHDHFVNTTPDLRVPDLSGTCREDWNRKPGIRTCLCKIKLYQERKIRWRSNSFSGFFYVALTFLRKVL